MATQRSGDTVQKNHSAESHSAEFHSSESTEKPQYGRSAKKGNVPIVHSSQSGMM